MDHFHLPEYHNIRKSLPFLPQRGFTVLAALGSTSILNTHTCPTFLPHELVLGEGYWYIFFKLARQVWCEFSGCVCEISVENKGLKRNLLVPSWSLSLTTKRPRPGFHVTAEDTNPAHLGTMPRDTTLLIPEWNPDDLEIRPQIIHE